MDTRRQGEASSSPSAKVQVVSLSKEGAPSGCMAVQLDDGSLFFLSFSCIKRYSVRTDSVFSYDDFALIVREDERSRIKRYTERLLRRFSYPASVLRKKLFLKGFSEAAVNEHLDELAKSGLIDDMTYARIWVESRLAKSPLSPAYLKRKLIEKGIPSDTASSVISDIRQEEVMESARIYAEKLLRQGLTAEKIASRLARRAYPYQLIKKILKKIKA